MRSLAAKRKQPSGEGCFCGSFAPQTLIKQNGRILSPVSVQLHIGQCKVQAEATADRPSVSVHRQPPSLITSETENLEVYVGVALGTIPPSENAYGTWAEALGIFRKELQEIAVVVVASGLSPGKTLKGLVIPNIS